ncbi:TetR/AcrR family transcriptional regulator [Leucobacter japonicus]|uniref:TetR/AcrR family transcriptional regulator n=1 Tax=Leucobacter japonicus TaxID=1461259 RepID=UPI0006A7B634|nr:TetR family transcriptional regulator [Leucobacter japonicus]
MPQPTASAGPDAIAPAAAPAFHVGLTPEAVIDAATELTRESHLFVWSIRDLARRIGVSQSVVYHHVGGKDLLCRRVVERVLERAPLPDDALDWEAWFRELLYDLGPLAHEFPGVAKWALMHGPTLPVMLPILERGMAHLHRAGFGPLAPSAYAVLLNTATLTVSIADDRLQHEGDGPRDHASMMQEFETMPQASRAVREMGQEFMRPFAEGGAAAERVRNEYYRFAIDTAIAGLAVRLADHLAASPAAELDVTEPE